MNDEGIFLVVNVWVDPFWHCRKAWPGGETVKLIQTKLIAVALAFKWIIKQKQKQLIVSSQ